MQMTEGPDRGGVQPVLDGGAPPARLGVALAGAGTPGIQ